MISSEHFIIYSRDTAGELDKAIHIINFLEHNYDEAIEIFDEPSTKTVIYMTSSPDELFRSDADPSIANAGFIWSTSQDVNMLALRQFAYRTIINNYPTYWIKQKLSLDKGNWLIDGLADYVTASIIGEHGMIKNQLDAFVAEQSSFEWYGAPEPPQYGATFTLFNFLVEKYGERIIDNILNNMDSAMVSNHRCGNYEQCVLLKAVYDTSGLSMNDKRHTITFESIVEEWNNYLMEEYGISTRRLVSA